jgi:hypothetical protein
MTSIKRHKVLLDTAAETTGEWFRLDNRYEKSSERIVHVDLTVGDTVILEGIVKDVRGSTPTEVLTTVEADDIAVIETFTADSTQHVLTGPWSYIRVRKTGTTGNAKVQGFI